MSYEKYLKQWDKKHKTKGGLIKPGRKKVKQYAKYAGKHVPLNDREASGGGVFDNYRTKR